MSELFDVSTLEACIAADLPVTESFLTSDMTIPDARSLWLKNSLLKKYVPSPPSKPKGLFKMEPDDPIGVAYGVARDAYKKHQAMLKQKTLELFEVMNERCKDAFDVDAFDQIELTTLNIMRERLFRLTHDADQVLRYSLNESFVQGGNGPGAVVGDCDSTFYRKMFAGDLASTNTRLQQHYQFYGRGTWGKAEILRSLSQATNLVAGSSLEFAPKSSEILRLISPQALLDMFYQKGTGK